MAKTSFPANLVAVAAGGFMALALAAPAKAGNESRYEAFALGDGTFEVVAEFTENAIYWCGAYLQTVNAGRPLTQRIYVLESPGPSRARPGQVAVRFGYAPPDGNESVSSFTNSVEIVGNSLSAAQAKGGCTERSASG